MWSVRTRALLLLVIICVGPGRAIAQSRFGIHVFGLSYHYNGRMYSDEHGQARRYEQINPGVGAEYLMRSTDRALFSIDAGAYQDSEDRLNIFAAPAARLKLGSHVLGGGGVVLLTSETYGTPIAPLPVLTGRWGRIALNGTWMPSLNSNEPGAIAMFGTIYLAPKK